MVIFDDYFYGKLLGRQEFRAERDIKDLHKNLKRRSPDAIQAATDFIKFREYVCGHKTYEHQMLWHRVLNTGEDNRYLRGIAGKDVSILSPRNSGKSSFLLQWIAWVLGVHVNHGISLKILLLSYVVNVASAKSRQIKSIIESERYQEVFPLVRPSKAKWGENEWSIDFAFAGLRTIDEAYTLACSGLAGSINSRRSHLILFDDLLKNKQEAQNKKIQDRMVENYYSIVRFTKHEGARCVNLGTRFAKHDVYTRVFVEPNWKTVTQSALISENGVERSFCEPVKDIDGEVMFGITLDTLRKEREDDLESFLLQRQNKIPESQAQGIPPHHIRYAWMPKEFERIVIGLDLASSTDGDYTAITVLGVSESALFVIDAWQQKMQGNMKKIDLLYGMWSKRKDTCKNPVILAVDSNKYAIDFKGDLEDYRAESTDGFEEIIIEGVKASGRGDKLDRLMSHSLLFEKGRIFFNKISEPLPDGKSVIGVLTDQIIDYNPIDSNDLMDSLEIAIFVARGYLKTELSVAG